jgi:hypothetical protein
MHALGTRTPRAPLSCIVTALDEPTSGNGARSPSTGWNGSRRLAREGAGAHLRRGLMRAFLLASIIVPVISGAAKAGVEFSFDQSARESANRVVAPWGSIDVSRDALGPADVTVALNAPYSPDANQGPRPAPRPMVREDPTMTLLSLATGFTSGSAAAYSTAGFDYGITCTACSDRSRPISFTATTGNRWLTPSEVEVVNVSRYFATPPSEPNAYTDVATFRSFESLPAGLGILSVALLGTGLLGLRSRPRGRRYFN